jgi:hypothetical protein
LGLIKAGAALLAQSVVVAADGQDAAVVEKPVEGIVTCVGGA